LVKYGKSKKNKKKKRRRRFSKHFQMDLYVQRHSSTGRKEESSFYSIL